LVFQCGNHPWGPVLLGATVVVVVLVVDGVAVSVVVAGGALVDCAGLVVVAVEVVLAGAEPPGLWLSSTLP
jgi:hypothetical protein